MITKNEKRRRIEQEIDHYRDCENVHDLPEIYHVWSNRYLRPKLQSLGFDTIDDLFIQYIVRICRRQPEKVHKIASIGAGNCDYEMRLAGALKEQNLSNFHFHCLELNPHMIARARESTERLDLVSHFTFDIIDIADWSPDDPFSVCLANHSLHHIAELEKLFAQVKRAIHPDGVFLINDMIGRNGHMRWPEALKHVNEIWSTMPNRYKYNHQFKRLDETFVNWDCSTEGNEGIRAQDILPVLIQMFHFEVFVAAANITYVFIDRGFGHNFDPDNRDDTAFIHEIATLDETLIEAGELTPTHMVAALRSTPVPKPRFYKHLTPEFCVRNPDADPR